MNGNRRCATYEIRSKVYIFGAPSWSARINDKVARAFLSRGREIIPSQGHCHPGYGGYWRGLPGSQIAGPSGTGVPEARPSCLIDLGWWFRSEGMG